MPNLSNNTVNPEARNETNVNFTGIFGPGGLVAALDPSELPSSPSSSLLKIIKEDNLTTHDDDGKQDQVCLAKKLKPSTVKSDDAPHPSCFQKDKVIAQNSFGSAKVKVAQRNSARSLEERVESIDHILEAIFSELDRETLLQCRLVSLRWASVGAKALEGIVETRVKRYRMLDERPYYHLNADADNSLNILMDLMNTSAGFPSTAFSFWNTNDDDTFNPKPFLEAHGLYIKYIRFHGWVSLDDVKQLLLQQSPHVQQLLLTSDRRLNNLYLQPQKMMDYHQPLVQVEDGAKAKNMEFHLNDRNFIGLGLGLGPQPKPTLDKLKVFKCDDHIPRLFVRHILDLSRNLVEVVLPEKYIHLLLEPINRLHLLKELRTDFRMDTIYALLDVAYHQTNSLALRRIEFLSCDSEPDYVYPRAASVMRQILEGSSATCQRLGLNYAFQFIMPQMPRVDILTIHGSWKDNVIVRLLHQWEKLGDTFPNLRTLNIRIFPRCDSLFDGPVPTQILSVRDVNFICQPSEIVLGRFQVMFPNATFHTLVDYLEDGIWILSMPKRI